MRFVVDLGSKTIEEAIDKGQMVTIDLVNESDPELGHNVLIVGYKENGNYIYMDPALGSWQEAEPENFGKIYVIPISGCK